MQIISSSNICMDLKVMLPTLEAFVCAWERFSVDLISLAAAI